jgi:hypothetical protein
MFSNYLYLLHMALIRSAYQDELDGVSQSLVDLTKYGDHLCSQGF